MKYEPYKSVNNLDLAGVNRDCGVVKFSAMCYTAVCSVPCGIVMLGRCGTSWHTLPTV